MVSSVVDCPMGRPRLAPEGALPGTVRSEPPAGEGIEDPPPLLPDTVEGTRAGEPATSEGEGAAPWPKDKGFDAANTGPPPGGEGPDEPPERAVFRPD